MKQSKPIIPGREPDRKRAKEETGRSFIVEASAGTGKTRTLIDRILRLVLEEGPNGPPLRLNEICAITFTEKAAGEMKLRLRQHFQQLLSESERLPGELNAVRLDRAGQAVYDLESASISTFHSFAVSLLKERPIEAGLDPRFAAMNEIQSELFFRQAWESWIGEALDERNPTLEKALRNGFRLDSLERLAQTLRGKWLTVRDLPCDNPSTEEELREKAHDLLRRGKGLYEHLLNPEDKLAGSLQNTLQWLESPTQYGGYLRKPGSAGAAAGWKGGKATVSDVREHIREVVAFREEWDSLPGQRLLHEVVTWIHRDFMISAWEARKRAGGLLDFDDQLRLAYELLRNNPSVRRECLQQYKTLLVDEFQDTDSIQWRIVLLLTSSDIETTDCDRLRPDPGRLFLVGDPKQSIYRFRNADIETYLDIVAEESRERLGLDLLRLTTNFRSVPSILDFVDAAFSNAMDAAGEGRYQQRYLAFGGNGYRKAESGAPAVHLLGDTCDGGETKRASREFLELESKRIAGLIQAMQGSNDWKIPDASSPEGNALRPPQYGDVAILLPVLTHANILEEVLRERSIPYVLEGGKFYYARSEVSSAITVLRAIANPNDRIALYGSLRSIFFGFSDEDLLRAHIDGQDLDYRSAVPSGSMLSHPFEIMRDLHRHRHERRASETYEILLARTGAREVLAARGFQSLANLNKLGRTLRALQGETTFSQVVELLGMMDEERLAESESRLMEERSNAVRVMSVHKAKGLDFPIVFVAALGVRRKGRGENLLADPHGTKVFAIKIGSKDRALNTKNWKALVEKEKRKDEAELARLLYVALTRARDHMVLSTHTAGWKKIGDTEQWAPDVQRTRLKPLASFIEECCSGSNTLVRWIETDTLDASKPVDSPASMDEMPDWKEVLQREYRELEALRDAALTEDTPTGDTQEKEDVGLQTAGKPYIRLGLAFHEAMEHADLLGSRREAESVAGIAARHELDSAGRRLLHAMLEKSLSSDLLQRACAALRSGRRIFREFPFVRMLEDSVMEEGKIDLLFEEEDGWVLVDYKTDRSIEESEETEEMFRRKYAAQVHGYIDALQSLSLPVSSAYVLLARTGNAIRMFDNSEEATNDTN